jgi:hypothetical protein
MRLGQGKPALLILRLGIMVLYFTSNLWRIRKYLKRFRQVTFRSGVVSAPGVSVLSTVQHIPGVRTVLVPQEIGVHGLFKKIDCSSFSSLNQKINFWKILVTILNKVIKGGMNGSEAQ